MYLAQLGIPDENTTICCNQDLLMIQYIVNKDYVGDNMNSIIFENELITAVKEATFIKNGSVENCEGLKYDFRVSKRVLRADFIRPLEFSDANAEEQEKLVIEPGEVAFVITEESLELPNNIFCQLSAKRKLSHGGIIILGGFTVDPQYKGKLVFGLYNISSRRYPIIPGKKLVAGIFYKIDKNEAATFSKNPEPLYDFPDDLLAMIKEYKPITNTAIESFSANIDRLQADVRDIRTQLDNDRTWKEDFKHGLDKNSEQIHQISDAIAELTNSLKTEIQERQRETSGLREKLGSTKVVGTILIGLLTAILGGGISLLAAWIAGVLQF